MRDYNYRKNWNDLLTPEIVKKLTLIHEYKGEQRLFIEAHKDELKELVEIAKVQSTEASNEQSKILADDWAWYKAFPRIGKYKRRRNKND